MIASLFTCLVFEHPVENSCLFFKYGTDQVIAHKWISMWGTVQFFKAHLNAWEWINKAFDICTFSRFQWNFLKTANSLNDVLSFQGMLENSIHDVNIILSFSSFSWFLFCEFSIAQATLKHQALTFSPSDDSSWNFYDLIWLQKVFIQYDTRNSRREFLLKANKVSCVLKFLENGGDFISNLIKIETSTQNKVNESR